MRNLKVNGNKANQGAATTITTITQADPAVVTAASHGLSNGDDVFLESILGMTELNGKSYEVANVTTDTFELLDIDSTGFTAYTSAGQVRKINGYSGIRIDHAKDIIFDNVYCEDCNGDGIDAGNGSSNNIEFRYVECANNDQDGFQLWRVGRLHNRDHEMLP